MRSIPAATSGPIASEKTTTAIAGVLGNLVIRALKLRDFIRPGVRTEFFLKIGLVLLGAGTNLVLIGTAATGAILQSLILITSVFFFGS